MENEEGWEGKEEKRDGERRGEERVKYTITRPTDEPEHHVLLLLSKPLIYFLNWQKTHRLYSAPLNKFSGFRHTLHSVTKRI